MKTALLATLLIAVVPSLAFAQTTAPVAGPPPTVQSAPVTPGAPGGQGFAHPGERHPEIKKAIHHLEEAKKNLEEAAHDYSGHRDQAIQLIDQAIAQLRTGEMDANHR